ncbi:TetR/AcrR family transcriptional regulator [Acinetobacter sp. BY419]|uniref:TetR/AcrR family transcriptional regulator n=1 Tax=Acinetobacter sp. BY419 TaxID=2820675 RepID=UPI001C20F851|nr:TetR/AcrR family transcriptional regulator [Acinetobacter sp. BY419]
MTKLGRPLVMSAEDRRKEIFNAAEQLFGEKGFEQVSMAEIAAAVGMSKKTLYVHFSDKRDLLKSLVSSSYIWPENAFKDFSQDQIQQLKQCLKMIAVHVLSERHIKLCRLAIVEQIGVEGLSQTFYEMGIAASRDHLIATIDQISKQQLNLKLSSEILADMLFGASISKPFIDLLFVNRQVDMKEIDQQIDHSVDAFFVSSVLK